MLLSKSDFMKYLECSCHLWLHKFHRDWLPELTEDDQRRFEAGHEVDDLARRLFPGGAEVSDFGFQGWENTKKLIAEGRQILYQPTVVVGDLTCRADIMVYHPGRREWDLYEVKSSASVKGDHYWDAGFQRLCFERAKIPIGRVFLVHINRAFVRDGEIDPKKFFVKSDITKDVESISKELKREILSALKVFESGKTPGVDHVNACVSAKKCEYLGYYFDKLSEQTRKSLHRACEKKRLIQLLERGLLDKALVPDAFFAALGEVRIPDPSLPDEIRINTAAIRKQLDGLEYPLYFLDYETIWPAIPPFDGYRPYQQTAFQYSLHVVRKPGERPEHYEFLASRFEDPAKELAADLKSHYDKQGTTIAWNANFEAGCNEVMAARLPEKLASFLRDINRRMYDPMYIFKHRGGHYNHTKFEKSASLKKVLPVLCPELAYDDLEIQEGGTASNGWYLLNGAALSAVEKKKLRKDMLSYCERDSYAMFAILQVLESMK